MGICTFVLVVKSLAQVRVSICAFVLVIKQATRTHTAKPGVGTCASICTFVLVVKYASVFVLLY